MRTSISSIDMMPHSLTTKVLFFLYTLLCFTKVLASPLNPPTTMSFIPEIIDDNIDILPQIPARAESEHGDLPTNSTHSSALNPPIGPRASVRADYLYPKLVPLVPLLYRQADLILQLMCGDREPGAVGFGYYEGGEVIAVYGRFHYIKEMGGGWQCRKNWIV